MSAKVLWLVTARSGSKGLPDKNIRTLGGIPLLAWPILAGLATGGQVWLSTDSPDYAEVGRTFGAHIPFLRPASLSNDTASSQDVCLHAMHHAAATGQHFDLLGLLQPTSPFVGPHGLRRGLDALRTQPLAHAAVAVRHAHPCSALMQPEAPTLAVLAQRLTMQKDCRRQAMPQEITPCGGFYIARWQSFLQQATFYTESSIPILLPDAEALDIDTALDMSFAEFLLQQSMVDTAWRS